MDPVKKMFKNGKALILAYDQGFEHGAGDFTDANIEPKVICDIANNGKFSALAIHKGIAEKYGKYLKIPLIVKLNGKTNLVKGEPISTQLCSVKEAKALGAVGVGYTIYLGSEHEAQMLKEFSKIEEEAHALGLVVMIWMYPRGKGTQERSEHELMAYATRVGLELGADIIKIEYNGVSEDLKWAVKAAGKSKVLIAGGSHTDESIFLKHVNDVVTTGASGLAVGRNVWQNSEPLTITKKIKEILFKKK
jgi:class I fructose-bisphosphate aldolase